MTFTPHRPSELEIAQRLQMAYQPGVIASSDGYAVQEQPPASLRCAAVLLPLIWTEQEWQLVLTRRTDRVEHHKGQVSFPGGGCDVDESTPEATALRESQEEIGLRPEDVRVLGRMNDIITITRYQVTPVVGIMPWPYPLIMETAEVDRVFTIPMRWLADPANWEQRQVTPSGTAHPLPVIIYHPYDGEILWGVSATITHQFLQVMGWLPEK